MFYIRIIYTHVVPLAAILFMLDIWHRLFAAIPAVRLCFLSWSLNRNNAFANSLCKKHCLFLRNYWAVSSLWHVQFIDPCLHCLPLRWEGGNATAHLQPVLHCTV